MLTKTRVTISQRNVIELARCFGRWLLIMRNPDSLEIVDLRGFCRRFTVFCSRFRNGGGSFDRCRGYWILDCWLCGLIFYAAWKIAERKVGDGSRLLLDSVRLGVRLLSHPWVEVQEPNQAENGGCTLRRRESWLTWGEGRGWLVGPMFRSLGSASRYLTTTFCTDEVGRVNTQCINHLRANAINSGLSDGDTGQISHLVSTDSQAFASIFVLSLSRGMLPALLPLRYRLRLRNSAVASWTGSHSRTTEVCVALRQRRTGAEAVSLRATLMSTIEPDSLVDVSFWARTMCPYQSLVFGEQDGHTGVDFSHGQ
ncbi:hypothetical protein KCU87_g341, partial [Aureobasidium melanogenum]